MGVFPHGILGGSGDPSVSAANGSKLAMFGEMMGSGNGLWAIEYVCPTTYPGSFVRKQWNLQSVSTTATQNILIDNVTACYFCWPGNTAYAPPCPTGAPTPTTVTLQNCASGSCAYPMITQVGFTITVQETAYVGMGNGASGTAQNITITKSYSNIQPRNMVTAVNIYLSACASANALGKACTPANYTPYLNGELQPDPPELANIASLSGNNAW
jgi:hypothetical protein